MGKTPMNGNQMAGNQMVGTMQDGLGSVDPQTIFRRGNYQNKMTSNGTASSIDPADYTVFTKDDNMVIAHNSFGKSR